MPASLVLEETILNYILKKETPGAITTIWLGLSSFTEAELEKKVTGKTFGEKEPTSGNGWKRVEVSTAAKPGWTVTKSEGATGFTKYENTNAIKQGTEGFEFKKVTGGSVECKTFGIFSAETEGNYLAGGTLTNPVLVNASATLEVAAKGLKFEVE
jgi:hypothetical protein